MSNMLERYLFLKHPFTNYSTKENYNNYVSFIKNRAHFYNFQTIGHPAFKISVYVPITWNIFP